MLPSLATIGYNRGMRAPRLFASTFAFLVLASFTAACGDDDGDDDDDDDDLVVDASPDGTTTPDAAVDHDAPTGGFDAAPEVDAAIVGNFDCLGAALPDTAPKLVTIGGQAFTVSLEGQTPVEGADLEAFSATDELLGTTTSSLTGAYSLSIATGGVPVDGYLQATADKYMITYLYPPTPIAADIPAASALLITPSNFGLLGILSGNLTQDADKAFLGIVVVDCNDMPVAGATVTTSSSEEFTKVRYTNPETGIPSANFDHTGPDGLAFVFNVPEGNVTVDASIGGMSLREHTLLGRAGVITTTLVQP